MVTDSLLSQATPMTTMVATNSIVSLAVGTTVTPSGVWDGTRAKTSERVIQWARDAVDVVRVSDAEHKWFEELNNSIDRSRAQWVEQEQLERQFQRDRLLTEQKIHIDLVACDELLREAEERMQTKCLEALEQEDKRLDSIRSSLSASSGRHSSNSRKSRRLLHVDTVPVRLPKPKLISDRDLSLEERRLKMKRLRLDVVELQQRQSEFVANKLKPVSDKRCHRDSGRVRRTKTSQRPPARFAVAGGPTSVPPARHRVANSRRCPSSPGTRRGCRRTA